MDELDSLLAELQAAKPISGSDNSKEESVNNGSQKITYPPPKSYQLVQSYQEQHNESATSGNGVLDNEDVTQKDANNNMATLELDKLLEELEEQRDGNNILTGKENPEKITGPSKTTKSKETDIISDNDRESNKPKTKQKTALEGKSLISATKELDDLMESLTTMNNKDVKTTDKNTPNQQDVPFSDSVDSTNNNGKKSADSKTDAKQLDSLMGGLQTDLSKQGITTESKGMCVGCHRMIVGQVLTALGQSWHPQHFVCTECEVSLANCTFYEHENKAYCEKDYFDLFAPKCASCNEPITAECLTAMDQKWHPEHFVCYVCQQPLVDEQFHVIDNKPYCANDFYELHAPTCSACNRKIIDSFVSALNGQWHPDCFVCMDCKKPFPDGSFMNYEGLPYCKLHYYHKIGSICTHCEEPITGRCIIVAKKKYHPEHFLCSFCQKQLAKGTFKERNDKPYCVPCYAKLFG